MRDRTDSGAGEVLAARFRVYLVTDRQATRGRPLPALVDACLGAGLRAVQLREKDLGGRALLDLARAIQPLTARYAGRLLFNDRVDVALAASADGVHLPGDGLPPDVTRGLIGPGCLIGVSTHSAVEGEAALQAGADFVVFGPVYDTPSKRLYGPPQGVAALAEVCRRVTIPVLAIGGVTPDRVPEIRAAGAAGVAVIRALLEADDPGRATRELLDAWERGHV